MMKILRLSEAAAEMFFLPHTDEAVMIPQRLTRSSGSGLFVLHSVLNHSCEANVAIQTDTVPTAQLEVLCGRPGCLHALKFTASQVIALRNIEKGEEMTIDYIGFTTRTREELTLQKRRSAIRSIFNFTCQCDKCRMEEALGDE